MKNHSLFFLMALLLSSCAPATIVPTTTATITATSSPTITPTFTPTSTSTPRPIPTVTPTLPETIQLLYPQNISESSQDKLQIIVNEAYWFYANLGCSPNGFKVQFTNGISGYVKAGVPTFGLSNFESEPSVVSTGISHELVHQMCQNAFSDVTDDMSWTAEGMANYFSAMEQIRNTGMNSGVRISSIKEHDRGMARYVSNNFCQYSLELFEADNAYEVYGDAMAASSDVAMRLLVISTPDGINRAIHYYKLLATLPSQDAFKEAFGRPKEEFYKQYKDECIRNFPTLMK